MAGRPVRIDLDRCPYCGGGMYALHSTTRHTEHAEPVKYKPPRKDSKRSK